MVTASIVLYNTPLAELQRVVDSLGREVVSGFPWNGAPGDASPSGPPVPVEGMAPAGEGVCRCTLYLVDHSPEPERPRISVPEGLGVEYEQAPNRGYGAGHNRAMRRAVAAGSRYHAVLNPDIYWTDPVIGTLMRYMEGHPRVGMMTPKVLYPDGRLQYTCKLVPTPLDLIGRRFLPAGWMRRRNARFELHGSGYDRMMDVPYMHGCFFMLRLEALKDVGMFDERFFMYPEDIDLTRRIHERWHTLFCPDVSLYHAHAAASRRPGRMLWVHMVNMVRYFNKWGWWDDPLRRQANRRLLGELGASSEPSV